MTSIPENSRKPKRLSFFSVLTHPITLAVLLTLGAFILYWHLAIFEECRLFGRFLCTSKLDLFWSASPNEIGDALAGLAGGLVLIWVIAATFMQSRELRQARDEYGKMAEALQAQADVFKDEKRVRREAEAARFLEELLNSMKASFDESSGRRVSWYFSAVDDEGHYSPTGTWFEAISFYGSLEDDLDKVSKEITSRLGKSIENLISTSESDEFRYRRIPESKKSTAKLVSTIEEILQVEEFLSKAEKERLGRLNLVPLRQLLTKLLNTPTLWLSEGNGP